MPKKSTSSRSVKQRLTKLGVDHVYQVDPDGRGHRVATDPKTLAAIYAFFHQHLRDEK